mmetsp:Transcript_15419/g.22653  ORF Transcript_15419/g.22653 Transcript_15419/m.22653 type:complete len:213 (-) Transcript_15419:376-1014(-)
MRIYHSNVKASKRDPTLVHQKYCESILDNACGRRPFDGMCAKMATGLDAPQFPRQQQKKATCWIAHRRGHETRERERERSGKKTSKFCKPGTSSTLSRASVKSSATTTIIQSSSSSSWRKKKATTVPLAATWSTKRIAVASWCSTTLRDPSQKMPLGSGVRQKARRFRGSSSSKTGVVRNSSRVLQVETPTVESIFLVGANSSRQHTSTMAR